MLLYCLITRSFIIFICYKKNYEFIVLFYTFTCILGEQKIRCNVGCISFTDAVTCTQSLSKEQSTVYKTKAKNKVQKNLK